MHCFWRTTIAVVTGCAFAFYNWTHWWPELFLWTRNTFLYHDLTATMFTIGVVLPTLLIAFGVFGLLTKYFEPIPPETLCRKCGYILRGIREPICSECGERI